MVSSSYRVSVVPPFLFIFPQLVIPEFNEFPADKNVTRTDDLELVCSGSGLPLPAILWLHNGSIVGNTSRVMITHSPSVVNITSHILVTNTSFSDSGNYVCVAVTPVFPNIISGVSNVLV